MAFGPLAVFCVVFGSILHNSYQQLVLEEPGISFYAVRRCPLDLLDKSGPPKEKGKIERGNMKGGGAARSPRNTPTFRAQDEITYSELYACSNLTLDGTNDRLYVTFHGYTGRHNDPNMEALSHALLDHGEKNLLVANYSKAVGSAYPDAVQASFIIAEKMADFLSNSSSQLRFVGVSLGAQTAGIVGHILKERYGVIVERIVGLDPALPIYADLQPSQRLDTSDATFVKAVHTNIGILGVMEPMGHADFYPNGGLDQPQCIPKDKVIIPSTVSKIALCSHLASVTYLAESVNGGFNATRCTSWEDFEYDMCRGWQTVQFGFDLPSDTRGMFFLRTRKDQPYGEPLTCHGQAEVVEPEAVSSSAKEKDNSRDSPLSLLLIFLTQFMSIWAIYLYYPSG